MSQTWTDNSFQADHAYDTDMANIEANLITLKSNFSGFSAPSNPAAGQNWFDTTQKLPRFRDQADSAWLAYLTGSADQKLWLYRNDSDDGWSIDATITDRVLALKGGAQAYNVAGGNVAGTWTQPDHTLTEAEMPAHDHGGGYLGADGLGAPDYPGGGSPASAIEIDTDGEDTAHNHGSTYRPAAAVGTLQYPDI
jgi:hypothetical protein